MNTTKSTMTRAALLAALLICVSGLQAQDAPAATAAPSATPAPAPAAGGSQDIIERIMQARDAGIKTALKATDDEWTVIQPLLDKVEKAQIDFMMSGNFSSGFGGRRGGNGGGGPGNNPFFQSSPDVQALSDAVQSDATSNDDLKAKMTAVRAARKKAIDNLAAARADLQKVLTLRQEAVLLSMGILD